LRVLAKVAGEEPGQQLLQRLQQRLQRSYVRAPASDRAVINRLANLGRARGPNGSLRPMKIETRIVPIEPAMGDDSARLRLEIANYLLVVHVKYHAGHHSISAFDSRGNNGRAPLSVADDMSGLGSARSVR